MPSSLLPLVWICLSRPWHLTLLRQGFSNNIAYSSLVFVAFTTTLHLQILATCQATRRPVVASKETGCWSSLLSFVGSFFHQSNFAILAIFPHTLAAFVFWSGPETQLCFRFPFRIPSPPGRFLRAYQPPCAFHWCYNTPPHFFSCVFTAKPVCDHSQGAYYPSNRRRSIFFRVLFQQTNKQKARARCHLFKCHLMVSVDHTLSLTSMFCCARQHARQSLHLTAPAPVSETWFRAALSAKLTCLWVWIPLPVAWLCWPGIRPSSAALSLDASDSSHSLSPCLDCFCQNSA